MPFWRKKQKEFKLTPEIERLSACHAEFPMVFAKAVAPQPKQNVLSKARDGLRKAGLWPKPK